jgi:CPA2 family monovalent cation:H+ antiporter-2
MEHANTDWILGLVVLFGLATLVSTIFRKLHIPTLIGFICSGILLQWWNFEAVDALKHETTFLAELGTILLMFTIGLELNPVS